MKQANYLISEMLLYSDGVCLLSNWGMTHHVNVAAVPPVYSDVHRVGRAGDVVAHSLVSLGWCRISTSLEQALLLLCTDDWLCEG